MTNKTKAPSPYQTSLFENLDLKPSKPQVLGTNAIKFLGHEKELSKEQIAFNRLTSRIRNIEARIARAESDHLELNQFFTNQYEPAMVTLGQSIISLALQIENTATQHPASKSIKRLLKRVMPDMLQEAFSLLEPSPEALALHDKYSPQKYQALMEEEEAEQNTIYLSLLEVMGIDVPPQVLGNAHDPEVIDAFTDQCRQELEAEQLQEAAARSRTRKKSKKQLEREQREQQKEQLKQRSLRDIYIALAKVLHPDTELDPTRKIQKEAFIKRATVAYNEGNLVELLHLEREWLEASNLQDVAQDKLQLYIEILKDQVKELEETCFRMEHRFHDIYSPFTGSLKAFRNSLSKEKTEAKQTTSRMKRHLEQLQKDSSYLEPCLGNLLNMYKQAHMDEVGLW